MRDGLEDEIRELPNLAFVVCIGQRIGDNVCWISIVGAGTAAEAVAGATSARGRLELFAENPELTAAPSALRLADGPEVLQSPRADPMPRSKNRWQELGKLGTVPSAVVTLEPGRVIVRVTPFADTSIFVPKI